MNFLYGTAGADSITATSQSTIYGYDNNDILNGSVENDIMFGGDDYDELYGKEGDDTLDTGAGYLDRAWGGAGNDTITATATIAYTFGDVGNDILTSVGGSYHCLRGGEGDDLIYAGSADAWFYGGNGNDAIYSGTGGNRFYGDSGDDTLYGFDGFSQLFGGVGNDRIVADFAKIWVVRGDEGIDTLEIQSASEIKDMRFVVGTKQITTGTLDGTSIFDARDFEVFEFETGSGNDEISLGAGNDIVRANGGDDILNGAAGDDALYGGSGTNQMKGGLGNDLIFGGSDIDTAIYEATWANLVISSDGSQVSGEGADVLQGVEFIQMGGVRITLFDAVNDAPLALMDVGLVTTDLAGSIVSGNVLSNDQDADLALGVGEQLGLSGISSSVAIITGTYGNLSLQADGSYTYVLDLLDVDTLALGTNTAFETFTYTVSDLHGLSSSGLLEIAVVGTTTPPVALSAVADSAKLVEAGGVNNAVAGKPVATGNLFDNDTFDPLADLSVVAASNGKLGKTAVGGVGLTLEGVYGDLIVQADGSYQYLLDNIDADTEALAKGAIGRDVFRYRVTDDLGGSDVATITFKIAGADDIPVIIIG